MVIYAIIFNLLEDMGKMGSTSHVGVRAAPRYDWETIESPSSELTMKKWKNSTFPGPLEHVCQGRNSLLLCKTIQDVQVFFHRQTLMFTLKMKDQVPKFRDIKDIDTFKYIYIHTCNVRELKAIYTVYIYTYKIP